MAKSGKKAISNDDKTVLAQVYHILKWKGLTASADSLAKEAKLQSQSLGSYSPSGASEIYKRLLQPAESSSESDSSSTEEEKSEPAKKNVNQRKQEVQIFSFSGVIVRVLQMKVLARSLVSQVQSLVRAMNQRYANCSLF